MIVNRAGGSAKAVLGLLFASGLAAGCAWMCKEFLPAFWSETRAEKAEHREYLRSLPLGQRVIDRLENLLFAVWVGVLPAVGLIACLVYIVYMLFVY